MKLRIIIEASDNKYVHEANIEVTELYTMVNKGESTLGITPKNPDDYYKLIGILTYRNLMYAVDDSISIEGNEVINNLWIKIHEINLKEDDQLNFIGEP